MSAKPHISDSKWQLTRPVRHVTSDTVNPNSKLGFLFDSFPHALNWVKELPTIALTAEVVLELVYAVYPIDLIAVALTPKLKVLIMDKITGDIEVAI